MIKLSICIPTYNRSGYLRQAIKSIIDQIDEGNRDIVEIAISDNCSIDDTDEMMNQLMNENQSLNIVYSKAESNLGPDRNYLRAVSIASGEYCWFLGSDDMIADGSLKRLLDVINEGHTVLISDRYNARFEDMKIIGKERFFRPDLQEDTVFSFANEKDWDFYLNRCSSLGGLFSYLSSIVVNRERWNQIESEEYNSFIGSAYVHVAVILKMLKQTNDTTLKYLKKPIAVNRTGNDSFLSNAYQRTMLDIEGYIQLSNLFEDTLVIKEGVREVVRRERPAVHWRLVLLSNKDEFSKMIIALKEIGYVKSQIDEIIAERSCRLLSLIVVIVNKMKLKFRKG